MAPQEPQTEKPAVDTETVLFVVGPLKSSGVAPEFGKELEREFGKWITIPVLHTFHHKWLKETEDGQFLLVGTIWQTVMAEYKGENRRTSTSSLGRKAVTRKNNFGYGSARSQCSDVSLTRGP